MKSGMLKQRVYIQQKDITQGALGQTITWKPVRDVYARVIPLKVQTIAQFQQLNTKVSHMIHMRGTVNIDLGDYRILHKDKVYEPRQSAKHFEDMTEVVVEEI
jgi:head-tail adaptor